MASEYRIEITGLRQLNRAAARAGASTKRIVRERLLHAGEAVRETAEERARTAISHMSPRSRWWRMRVGATIGTVYVAPRTRGSRDPNRKRPRFGVTLIDDALWPALTHNVGEIEHEVEHALGDIATIFERS
jgi:hypothetical protein